VNPLVSCHWSPCIALQTSFLAPWRPPLLVHDHCYASGVQRRGDVLQDSLQPGSVSQGECAPEHSPVKDGRRCVLCTLEGDAECMVSCRIKYMYK